MFCPSCRLEQPVSHSYCVRCGIALPGELLSDPPVKRTRLFAGVKAAPGDDENAFLRVSCYLKQQVFRSGEDSVTIPGRHVRFSVWAGEGARCVISIPESEARELATFIASELSQLRNDTEQTASISP